MQIAKLRERLDEMGLILPGRPGRGLLDTSEPIHRSCLGVLDAGLEPPPHLKHCELEQERTVKESLTVRSQPPQQSSEDVPTQPSRTWV
jgi:hypothetical protein